MAEDLSINLNQTKSQVYAQLLPQVAALIEGESDLIANLANIAAALKEAFQWLWVGFYRVQGDELVLGPFQGPVACTRIAFGRGVCGTAWQGKRTIIVADVEKFPGHIACSSRSRSEIVVPGYDKEGNVKLVLDVDSELLNAFDEEDGLWLEKFVALLKD